MTRIIKRVLFFICCIGIAHAFGNARISSATKRHPTLFHCVIAKNIPSVDDTSLNKFDYHTETKLPWLEEGYQSWSWRGNKINYLSLGLEEENSDEKPVLLLVHGFGASVYHWRYNIPVLARKYRVFAIDLLGFGLSDKPIVEYTLALWKDQMLDFIAEVVHPATGNTPCTIAGNSLGGYISLFAASDKRATQENLIRSCALLNAAGKFQHVDESQPQKPLPKEKPAWLEWITSKIQKLVISLSFFYTKQPLRIAQVLRQVYPVNPDQIDDELVRSIQYPAFNPNASEVFYRVVKAGTESKVYVDDLLKKLQLPLALIWGVEDPWIRPKYADRVQQLYPSSQRFDIISGHCPHDETPELVNEALDKFVSSLDARVSKAPLLQLEGKV